MNTEHPITERIVARAAPWKTLKWRSVLLFAAVALVLPWVLLLAGPGNFFIHMLIMFFLWSVVAQSWNLVLGVAGIFSLAQLALFAIGGWTTGVLSLSFGWNPWVSLMLAPVAATLAALLLGLPILRLRGVYVVLLTLAFSELLRNYATNGPQVISGGGYGLNGVPRLSSGLQPTGNNLVFSYYVAFLFFMLATFAIWRIFHSPVGVAFNALRDSEAYAISRGINPYSINLFLFGFSAFFTGLAGGIMTNYLGSIAPSVFSFSVLVSVLAMIVIGGWGSFGGPILGTALVLSLQEGLRDLSSYRTLVLGLALALIAVVAPQGLWPMLRDSVQRFLDEPQERTEVSEYDPSSAPDPVAAAHVDEKHDGTLDSSSGP